MSTYFEHLQQLKLGLATNKPKEKKRIPKVSEKRKKDQRKYRKIVKEMISEETVCKVGAPGCTKKPSGLHHLQKRSPNNLTKKNNLIPACSSCNLWVETNSKTAKELGFTISRFKK